MRKLLTFLIALTPLVFLTLADPAHAFGLGLGNRFGKLGAMGHVGGAAATYLLDTLTVAPSVAYSTRKLRAAYAGAALRVIRSSDSTQSDIGFASNGQLNTAVLSTFCAATNCGVLTWYDQSTYANNASANGGQPQLVNAGTVYTLNGNPAIRFGVVSRSAFVFTVSLSQPTTIALAAKHNSQVANGHYTDGGASSPRQLAGVGGTTTYSQYAGTASLTAGTLDLLSHDIIGIFNGASSSVVVDGTTVISGNPGTNGMGTQVIGSGNGGAGVNTAMDGWMGEYIVFPSVLGSTDQATIRTSWQAQWGTQ